MPTMLLPKWSELKSKKKEMESPRKFLERPEPCFE
jgi:hypothetical protein